MNLIRDIPKLPITGQYSNEILSLPMFPELTENEIQFICDNIKSFLKRVR